MDGLSGLRCFNPRAREGRDVDMIFQRGGIVCFNPRAREGRDHMTDKQTVSIFVSIHAPARGATNHHPLDRVQ